MKNLYNSFVGGEFENVYSVEGDVLVLLKFVVYKLDVLEYLEKGVYEFCCYGSLKNCLKKLWVFLDEKDVS